MNRNTKRALCERLWAEGVATDVIVKEMGWNKGGHHPPSTYIATYRRLGWNLPVRDPQRSASVKRGRWGR